MTKENHRASRGRKLEIKVIPPACLDMTLAEIARLLGNGPPPQARGCQPVPEA